VGTARTLADYGPDASEAIPGLCRGLNSEKSWAAAYAIGSIHCHPEIAVPALIDEIEGRYLEKDKWGLLRNSVSWVNSIWALGEFEADARPAIPALREYLQDPHPITRETALGSLRKILPPDQVKTLVPALLKNVNDPDPNLRSLARDMLKQIAPIRAIGAGVV
jgi:hypothetical protein